MLDRISWELAGATATGLFLAGWLYRHLTDPLRDIPTPPYWERNAFVIIRGYANGTILERLLDWHRLYGPIVRVGIDVVSVNDIEAYRQIYGNPRFIKNVSYDDFNTAGEDLFNTRDREFHKRRKGLLMPLYGTSAIRVVEPMVREVGVDALINRLCEKGRKS